MKNYLKYIIDNELWRTNPLLTMSKFIDYCKKRGIITSKEHLTRLEKLGIFYPIAKRIKYYKKDKSEEESDSITMEMIQDPELWEETSTERLIPFDFYKGIVNNFLERGLLWQPSILKKNNEDEELTKTESYYSKFQCYKLANIITYTRSFIDYVYGDITAIVKKQAKILQHFIQTYKNCNDLKQNPGIICQIISDRYYPETLSDRRAFTINTLNAYEWNWYEYKRTWDAKKALRDLELEPKDLEMLSQHVVHKARDCDPLEHWQDLIEFVAVRKKKMLKGHALFAQELYRMAKMFSMFYEEIAGKQPAEIGDSSKIIRDKIYGIDVYEDNLKYLTYLTNEYHLNPRPKLILVVEGESEKKAIPKLIKRFFGYDISTLGVYIWDIKGVDNFSGEERYNPYSALGKFIDYNHHKEGILVYVMLDKENKIEKIVNKLVKAHSIFNPAHSITRDEYIHLFDPNIEFHKGNFSDDEIAGSLTELCEKRYIFNSNEIEKCRNTRDSKQIGELKKLYKNKTGREIIKPELLCKLVYHINVNNFDEEKCTDDKFRRPILNIIRDIIRLASKNRDVSTDKYMKDKLNSDFFHYFFKKK